MAILLWSLLLIGFLVLMVAAHSRYSARLSSPEESAHAAALNRRTPGHDQNNQPATVTVLGADETYDGCRVIKLSRTSVRFEASCTLPLGSQVQLQSGENCFIGEVRSAVMRNGSNVVDLEVLSSNYRGRRWFLRTSNA